MLNCSCKAYLLLSFNLSVYCLLTAARKGREPVKMHPCRSVLPLPDWLFCKSPWAMKASPSDLRRSQKNQLCCRSCLWLVFFFLMWCLILRMWIMKSKPVLSDNIILLNFLQMTLPYYHIVKLKASMTLSFEEVMKKDRKMRNYGF